MKEKRLSIGEIVASCDEAAKLAASIEKYTQMDDYLAKSALIKGTLAAIQNTRDTTYYEW